MITGLPRIEIRLRAESESRPAIVIVRTAASISSIMDEEQQGSSELGVLHIARSHLQESICAVTSTILPILPYTT